MRRMVVPLLLAALGAFHAVTGGCSSSSTITGGGGCESFCTKWVGARCRNGPTMEACLANCAEQQSRCSLESNALLKCATIEASIACETGSGQPRIVGCVPRETALVSCFACDRFCEGWSQLGCPLSPSREECLTVCLDRRCSREHRAVVECMVRGSGSCASDGQNAPTSCFRELGDARSCTSALGQPEPFHYIPIVLVDDAGHDSDGASDGASDGNDGR